MSATYKAVEGPKGYKFCVVMVADGRDTVVSYGHTTRKIAQKKADQFTRKEADAAAKHRRAA